MRKFILFFVVVLVLPFYLSCQKKIQFEGVDTYIPQSLELIKTDKNITKEKMKKVEEAYLQYGQYWQNFPLSLQQQIVTLSNEALKNKVSLYPQVFAWVECQNLFLALQGPNANYQQWLDALQQLLAHKKSKQFCQLYTSTALLLSEQCLFKSTSATWLVSNLDFTFQDQCFVFPSLDLICKAYKDSSCIRQTQGIYDPLENKFKGEKGFLYWERQAIPNNEMYAQFNTYEIDIESAHYSVDSVYLYRADYFKQAILGFLDEKLSASTKLTESSYPQFTSYDEAIYLHNLFPNVDIQGAFLQKGSQFYFGTSQKSATLLFTKEQTLMAKIQADNFVIKDAKISAKLASWVLYLDNDSIQHRSSDIRYNQNTREVLFMHSTAFRQPIPFVNTYHQIDMYCEAVYWKIDSGLLDFGLMRIPNRKGITYFKSHNIYSESEHQAIVGSSSKNPLYLLKKAAEAYHSNTIPIAYIAQFAGLADIAIRTLLLDFAAKGFVIYEVKNDEVSLQPKLFHYLAVSAQKEDYDILNIESEVDDFTNARLNLHTFDLQIEGVKKILLSEKQNVYIQPTSQRILFKKNRDFIFDGLLHCGSFDFDTKQSYFSYADFKIDIQSVDTLRFVVKSVNANGESVLHPINTQLEEFSGVLFIDSMLNKGGLRDFPIYPIFISAQPSYAYYDRPTIQQGAYQRDSFYFKVHSFRLERLNNFSTDSICFKGEFMSGGMIPNINEALVVMPDYSLGFTHKAPSEGYPLYHGKGRFFDTLRLSNAGFRGQGRLQYLSSESKSKDFLFTPKEMHCQADDFALTEQNNIDISYPSIHAQQVQQYWQIDSNIYHLYAPKHALYVYRDSLQLRGAYYFSPKLSQADGMLGFPNQAQMQSANFQLRSRDFRADTLAFRVFTADRGNIFVQTDNYRTQVDLNTHKANFISNASNSKVIFPLNMYQSYMNQMNWDIVKNELSFVAQSINASNFEHFSTLSLPERISLPKIGVEFVSLHPKQDSLRFNATKATYHTQDSLLEINEIPYIACADAFIAPHAGQVKIGVRAKIQNLNQSVLMLNNDWHDYILTQASVDMLSRKQFKAQAYYSYSSPDLPSQTIYFSDIKQDLDGHTFAMAQIGGDTNTLLLDDGFEFEGKLSLSAQDSMLFFAGRCQMRYNCDNEDHENQLLFQAYIDPANVRIPIQTQSKNPQGRTLGCGFYTQSMGAPFFSFLRPLRLSDRTILQYEGFLKFDKLRKMYTLIDSNQTEKLTYKMDKCFANTSGWLDPNIETDDFALQFYGDIAQDGKEQSVFMQSVLNIDYFFNDDLQKQMAETFVKNTDLAEAEMNTSRYLSYLSEVLSPKEMQKCKQELETYGSLTQIPEKLQKSICFSNVLLTWDAMRNAYISSGKINLASIGKTSINKQIKAYIQLTKNRKGDVVDLYLEASRYEWYYLNYTNGLLQIMSSKIEFNDAIDLMKPSKRKKGNLEYTLSTQRKKNDFVSRMQNLGLEGGSYLDEEEYVEPEEE